MFGLFNMGRSAEPAPSAPVEPVIAAPSTTCCAHCRLKPRRVPDLADFTAPPVQRPRFGPAFEAESVRLEMLDRQAHDRLRELTGEVGRLERDLGGLLQRGTQRLVEQARPWQRPNEDLLASQLAAYERDLKTARAQLAYARQTWEKARRARNAHRAERVRRERAIDAARIAERDQRREAARRAAGIAPLDEVEAFTIAGDVVAHLSSRIGR